MNSYKLQESKTPLQSKTIKASLSNVVAVVALLLTYLGMDINEETQTKIVDSTDALILAAIAFWQVISSVIAIYGRVNATKPVTKDGKPVILEQGDTK